ncbi:hypothetical protein DPX16_14173 [Anabarilius grahami]|uniref:Uncharacterized protein n=1 Tax=Anabarilius grahami TaxID=495550 RepID=A0A3N0XGL5_ANAGA|nr:hypothetical protein DPX16_14173 [Anabarilius grahami]
MAEYKGRNTPGRNTPSRRRRTSGDESKLRGWLTSAASMSKVVLTHQTDAKQRARSTSVLRLRDMKCLSEQQAAVAEQPIRMIRWPDGPTSSNGDSTFRIGRKKADEDQLQPTVWNTLRKLSRPTKKTCPTADRRLGCSRKDLIKRRAAVDIFLINNCLEMKYHRVKICTGKINAVKLKKTDALLRNFGPFTPGINMLLATGSHLYRASKETW